VLRREGLYHSHIKEWTAARDAGAVCGVGDGRRSSAASKVSTKGEVERLRAQNTRLSTQLTPDSDGVGHHGKSTCALGDALREHGHLDPVEEVMTVAFDGLRRPARGRGRDQDCVQPDRASPGQSLSLASVMGPPRCHEHGTTWMCQ
jgi:hypothetical protein